MRRASPVTTVIGALWILTMATSEWGAQGFAIPTSCIRVTTARISMSSDPNSQLQDRVSSTANMDVASNGGKKKKTEYTRDVILREEAESPFRKVRFWLYASLGAGAMTSLFISLARIAAALGGVNQDLMSESTTNAVVDGVGLVVLGFLYKNDLDAQESRYKRASKGAELAKLLIRASPSLLGDDDNVSTTPFTTNLASLRRGRGIEKRVVIVAAGSEKMKEIIEDAKRLSDQLTMSDLVVVPVLLPSGAAPTVDADSLPDCVALPVGNNWRDLVDDECEEAIQQGVNAAVDGISIVVKKNGKVGQRTKGVFLGRMVGDVTDRREMGLDVSSI